MFFFNKGYFIYQDNLMTFLSIIKREFVNTKIVLFIT